MVCSPGTTKPCYEGTAGTEGKGICVGGTATCDPDGSKWGACVGQVVPKAETCAATEDEDCDGLDCVMWAHAYGDPLLGQHIEAIAKDPTDGTVVVTGSFSGVAEFGSTNLTAPSGASHLLVARIGANGASVWARSFTSGAGSAAAVDGSGNVYVAGQTAGSFAVGNDIVTKGQFLIKLDKEGTPIWAKSLGNAPSGSSVSFLAPSALVVAPDGDLLIAGQFVAPMNFGDGAVQPPAPGLNGYVAKLRSFDGAGSQANTGVYWSRVYEGAATPPRLAMHSAGVILGATFTGTTHLGSGTLTSAGGTDAAVVSLGATGTTGGALRLGDAEDQSISAIHVTASGTIIIAGRMLGTISFPDLSEPLTAASGPGAGYLAHLHSSLLSTIWAKGLGSEGDVVDIGTDADWNLRILAWFTGQVDLGNGVLVAGAPRSLLLASLSSNDGAAVWTRAWAHPAQIGSSLSVALAVTPAGHAFVGGTLPTGAFDLGTGALIQPNDSTEAFLARFAP